MKKLLIFLLIPFLLGMSTDEIFDIAKKKMDIMEVIETPSISFLSRNELVKLYFSGIKMDISGEEYDIWKDLVREGLEGFYIPKSKVIIIYSGLEGLYKDSVIYHEFIHLLQDFKNGRITKEDNRRIFREMQAELFQEQFLKKFKIKY